MRSVTLDRKPRGKTRTASVRPAASAKGRAKRDLPQVQPGATRAAKPPGPLARLKPFFKRPMMVLCGLVLLLVLLAALLVSGVIGRGVLAAGHGLDIIAADAGFGIS